GWPGPIKVSRQDELGFLQTVFNDMTEHVHTAQERLLALLDRDPLTDLENHRRFHERLADETDRCAESGETLSILLIDMDNFQDYNQAHGLAVGDAALVRVADLRRTLVPEGGFVSRFGGEEFAVALPARDLGDAERLGEKICCAVAERPEDS